jgi:Skp family chaperone for outer membrane proteins
MKSNKLFSLFIALFIGISSYAQNKPLNAYVIGFYNLENLFDTIDDPIKNDAQFLPD